MAKIFSMLPAGPETMGGLKAQAQSGIARDAKRLRKSMQMTACLPSSSISSWQMCREHFVSCAGEWPFILTSNDGSALMERTGSHDELFRQNAISAPVSLEGAASERSGFY
jgi:hypothetical protein